MIRALLVMFAVLFSAPALAAADDRVAYQQVVERMHGGEGYYQAAAAELREGNFPLKPALAFRPPTLAWLLSLFPNLATRYGAMLLVLFAAIIAWARSLADLAPPHRLALVALLMCGLANVGGHPLSVYQHEVWAILAMALSLAFYRNLLVCALFACVAVFVRETALTFIAAVAIVALLRSDYRRVAAMVGIGVLAVAAWLYHAHLAAAVTLPTDPVSPGWLRFEGFPLVLAATRWNLLTAFLPDFWLAALLAVMALGLAITRRAELQVAGLTAVLFCIALLAVGRPDNAYWGIMFAPFLGLGLPDLVRRAAS